jgi:aminoglycoside 2'-N-acetyltransferase I
MNIELAEAGKLSVQQEKALDQLGEAVYPPEVAASLPGKSVTWASPQWSLLLWEQEELVTHAGLLVREILQDGTMRRIGGIGGVATHPAKQGRGFASQAMREAAKRFDTDFAVSYALLFCRSQLVPFYERLLWKPFMGKVFVDQPEGKVEFTVNGAMVLDVREPAPKSGTLDLNGLPW